MVWISGINNHSLCTVTSVGLILKRLFAPLFASTRVLLMSKCSSQQVLMRWDTKRELYFENLRIYTAPRTLIKNDVRVRVPLLLIVFTKPTDF